MQAPRISTPEMITSETNPSRVPAPDTTTVHANAPAFIDSAPATARGMVGTQPLHPAFRPLAIPALVAATQIMRGGMLKRVG